MTDISKLITEDDINFVYYTGVGSNEFHVHTVDEFIRIMKSRHNTKNNKINNKINKLLSHIILS